MTRIFADDANYAFSSDDFALGANLLNRCPDLHLLLLALPIQRSLAHVLQAPL